uniref:Dimeric alpha-amylase inhibitor n=3 Tax=Kengyilia TaxID=50287 RepID=T1WGZ8_9POAL|nr:dimeric alpha-amylase inhibitor [Kengyilia alatavica var. longiglumis]AGU17106.1 dimeric alpha-amylase inhibitor [Kengyilia melanthera]AGU17118.1 dimeric alpha-amylase inhibitor [Kengyilia rigidula]
MLVATPIAAEYGAWSDNSGPWMCYPGQAYQVPALPSCHPLLKLQCNGSQVPEAVLRDCCQQLADISKWCRCGALYNMLDNMYKEPGMQEGQAGIEVFPGCRREVVKLTAASFPAVCKLPIVIDASGGGAYVCKGVATYPDA